jgi:dipeptidyl aminopeptidase/acylaminoacyl peptidase
LIFAARNPDSVDGVLAFCPATDMAAMYNVAAHPRFPKHFSESLNESYGGTPDQIPEVYRERSVRYHIASLTPYRLAIIHGTADEIMPVENIHQLVADLRAANSPVRYQEIEGGNHDAPLIADYLPLLDWLAEG